MIAAIDFGTSTTDVLVWEQAPYRFWSRPSAGDPSVSLVKKIFKDAGVSFSQLQRLICTGGRHRLLPGNIGQVGLHFVPEVNAIGRGGQALLSEMTGDTDSDLLVVSAGSGTAIICASNREYRHVTGTAVGGGTLTGLGRLLVHTTDPREIDQLANKGNASAVDLNLQDVVSGPIGKLPPEATAVNFGRLSRQKKRAEREDLAAALVTMVGQVIALLAINAARAHGLQQIIFTGHLIDLATIRTVIQGVADIYQTKIWLPASPGRATVMGAFHCHMDEKAA